MPKIRVLEKQIAELIAAGEVVERPSSVIKELVENSMDAGASVITVEIRRGGITFMRVTDNGCGISLEDVPTAFLRHATSKITRQDDLDSIMTLGFRGEALASISAVSHVELLTKTAEAETGVRYMCGGEEEPLMEEAGCPEGTTILIRDLFYNTPARMKFLKKDATEGNSVAGVMDKLALSHPEISFRFIRDGKEELRTPGDNKLSSAIYGVYGKEFLSTLIPVDYEYERVKVTGYISKPSGSRPNRSMQNFFINGRYIRSRTAMAALEEACKGSIMVGKFPACVLHLSLSFGAVDVNVHPAKLEVRFVNERPIFDAVYHAVKSALNTEDAPKVMELKSSGVQPYAPVLERQEQMKLPVPGEAPQTPTNAPPKMREAAVLRDSVQGRDTFHSFAQRVLEPEPEKAAFTPVEESSILLSASQKEPSFSESVEEALPSLKEKSAVPQEAPKQLLGEFHSRILGEAFGTYILVEYSREELMFIDKHAAHERLLYEKLKQQGQSGEAQALLEPVPVTLDKEEYSAVLARQEELLSAGFEVEDFGRGTVLIRSVPLLLDGSDAAASIMEIAGYLASSKKDFTTEHMDWVYHNVACRAAMKAGDTTTREELISLAEELEKNPQVRYCPHGRPVYILLKRREIERQFGRS
ncbi:DNA mismatch repair endonuclease MutL [Neglectibacter caecimuris]|uniref:DNA mismatch repair endonuclease MutL n=1 Tax=Neglectibacter caecimuris TaxID=3093658 RepID=UPI002AC94E13|nr:DNA mismatch repair endonuclease MutL [Neglectibacter sp. M00184]